MHNFYTTVFVAAERPLFTQDLQRDPHFVAGYFHAGVKIFFNVFRSIIASKRLVVLSFYTCGRKLWYILTLICTCFVLLVFYVV